MDLTYQSDVRPHLRRAMGYRILREHRRQEMHRQQGAPASGEIPLTWEFDVGPHLRRARAYRALRERRWYELHKHDGRGRVWSFILVSLALFWGLVLYGIREMFR
jgi:hypothetical protein